MNKEDQVTIEDMKSKIQRVKDDIAELQKEGDSTRRFEVLNEYLEYLQDELRMMQQEQRQNRF
jgi:hypothetical protein